MPPLGVSQSVTLARADLKTITERAKDRVSLPPSQVHLLNGLQFVRSFMDTSTNEICDAE